MIAQTVVNVFVKERLTQVEKGVIVNALRQDIESERESMRLNPGVAAYCERNIKFREELIAKVESL